MSIPMWSMPLIDHPNRFVQYLWVGKSHDCHMHGHVIPFQLRFNELCYLNTQ